MRKAQPGLVTCSRKGLWAIPGKIQTNDREGWGHRISRDFKLKKKHVEIPGVSS